MLTFILIVVISLSVSFVCSLMEACVLSLSLTDIALLSEKRPLVAHTWRNFKENIQRPIAVILIINTFANTIGAALSGAQFDRLFGPKWLTVYSLCFSMFMIQWTEILPKTLGVKFNKRIAVFVARPLKFCVFLFHPLVKLSQLINQLFVGKKTAAGGMLDPSQEISVLARFASIHNLISKDQEHILARTMSLSKMKVKDVMLEKDDIKYLSTSMNLMDALIEAHLHHHTRLPLIEGSNSDSVLGYINYKDIVNVLRINPQNPTLRGLCRPIIFFNENDPIALLLNRLIKEYQHIAMVRNQEGHIVGLVTLEDVLESIVGEIHDEYDILPVYYFPINEQRFLVGGGVRLQELHEKVNQSLPALDMSLNEWLLQLAGKTPKPGTVLTYNRIVCIVRKVRRSNIYEVILEEKEAGV